MITPFPIINVSGWEPYRDEPMGSKSKQWFIDSDGTRWLFKQRRGAHGEDWAEKIAAEIASQIGVPHAHVELAVRDQMPGSISRDFLGDPAARQLMHGNELLVQIDATYPAKGPNFKIRQHTIDRALAVLGQDFIGIGYDPLRPVGISTAPEQFVGYLLLDALVGNTDRHHENWAIIVTQGTADTEAALAPSFDHASCLGRELTDEYRSRRLADRPGAPTFDAYRRKMPSRWYRDEADSRPLHPLDAFSVAARKFPAAAEIWLSQVSVLTDELIQSLVDAVPAVRISDVARQFVAKLLRSNRDILLEKERK